jgi:(R)-2-hydroxyacyl-CoA dehydratese activating ATPase
MTDDVRRSGIFAGVDVGASTAKAVVIDGDGTFLGGDVRASGMDFTESGSGVLAAAAAAAGTGLDGLERVVATGYGRDNQPLAQETRTEISCHARGAYHHHPHAMVVIDVGGQDNKIIRLSETGKRLGFRMNRKCAAGTGAFLEEISARLGVDLDELNRLAAGAAGGEPLNSFCTVFASTEVLARIRAGDDRPTLARSIFASVVARVVETAPLAGDVMVTGGVAAHNPAFVEMLREALGRPVLLPPAPQLVGALGAALIARDEANDPSSERKSSHD